MQWSSNSGDKWDVAAPAFCHPRPHKVLLSWLPCSAAEKQIGEQRREGRGCVWGGGGGVYEWDAHWPCHHHKPPVWSNILTDWMSVWLGTHHSNSSTTASPVSHSSPPQHTHTTTTVQILQYMHVTSRFAANLTWNKSLRGYYQKFAVFAGWRHFEG